MSITLMAYPMAFLIDPNEAKGEILRVAANDVDTNKSVATNNLMEIKVLTNIKYDEMPVIMRYVDCSSDVQNTYKLSSGLKVKWLVKGKYVIADLYGCEDAENLQALGEQFFQELDKIAQRNVRLIDSNEYFYYIYDTGYNSITEIYANLKKEGATQIFSTSEDEVVANLNGQSIKYYKNPEDKRFLLEVEQKVTILNIGMKGDYEGTNVTYGLTNLKIKTNIRKGELKKLLKASNYLFYEADAQTPLKNSNATLNWIMKDGYYTAEFAGSNNVAITKEAEVLFRKLNKAAGRDLRYINDVSTTVYTYKTNYTDKSILINTLTEHGAEELVDANDEVSCKLFGMEMVYYKKDGSDGYTLDITQVSDKAACQDVINDLNDEYGLNIQELTYNKIKERLDQENLRLESETVMEDNSIVLTIEV